MTIKLEEVGQSEQGQVEPAPDLREGIPEIPVVLRQSGQVSTLVQKFGTTTQGIVNQVRTYMLRTTYLAFVDASTA